MTTGQALTVRTGAWEAPSPMARSDRPQKETVGCGFEVNFLPTDLRVGQMRRITLAQLSVWGLTALCDAAMLVVSELVTNAVRHGRGDSVGLRVKTADGELRIEVTDGNPAPARLREAGEAAENGRGLFLVAAVAKKWGVSPDGRTTWCSLAIPDWRS